jgi:hypothetical protein
MLPGHPQAEAVGETTPVDVEIVEGKVPVELGDGARACGEYEISGSEILLRAPQAGRCLIRGGDQIVLDAQADADPRLIEGFVAGPALGTLLHQRRAMPLHGSCVARGGHAVAFLGDAGAGKSTTAMLFRKRGYDIVNDDVITCELRPGKADDPEITVNPAARSPRLWDDAAAMLDVDRAPENAEYPGTSKGVFGLPPTEFPEAPRLDGLFLLRWLHPCDGGPEVTRIPSFQALALLRKNIYREPMVGALGLEVEYMARLAKLVRAVPVFVLARPYGETRLPNPEAAVSEALGRS